MKILLTGMTSAQVNPVSHRRSYTYMGLLYDTLRNDEYRDHEVFWREPSVLWTQEDLQQYQYVFVGLAPVTALGANRAYGALSVISQLYSDRRLRLVVDAPEPAKIGTTFKSVYNNPDDLVKPFFSYRKEYHLVQRDSEIKSRVLQGVGLLATSRWPKVVMPSLPWQSNDELNRLLPENAQGRAIGVNLDDAIVARHIGDGSDMRSRPNIWSYEKNTRPGWLGRSGLSWPVEELPTTFRKEINSATMEQLRLSKGCLIHPTRSGTWWTPRYAMSLCAGTPVFSDWLHTQWIGDSWMHLPSAYEVMGDEDRSRVAHRQFREYFAAIGRPSIDSLHDALGTRVRH